MRPMELKEPAKCCGARVLLWIRGKGYYACPCGQLKANESGLPLKTMRITRRKKRIDS